MKILINGINENNSFMIYDIAGRSGYAGSKEIINDTTCIIDLGTEEFRNKAGISSYEVLQMLQNFICAGFEIKLLNPSR